jgi:peptide/nickel transport system ATP-binding protein
MTSAPEILVEARDLEMSFDVSKPWLSRVIDRSPKQIVKAVAGVTFEIPRGKTFSLVGESGCGKSTVARLVVGLYRPTGGFVTVGGQELARMGRRESKAVRQQLTMIFQDPFASLNPRWRVADIIAEPLRAFELATTKAEQRKKVDGLLRQVGLAPADGDKFPHEFSGGQRQRISIARALASQPDFIVCDEPTSALDVSVQAQILNLMTDLQRDLGLTYLFISHNLSVVAHVSDRVGVMYLGRIVEEAPTAEIFTKPRHPYTRLLLDTLPDLSMQKRDREPVAGEVPNPINPPPGCHFHPRCPLATDICKSVRPEMRVLGNARVACHHAE